MRCVIRCLAVVLLVTVFALPAAAQIDPNASSALLTIPVNLMVLPSGTGPLMPGGLYIKVQVIDMNGVAVVGLTNRDFEVDGFPPATFGDGFLAPATWDVPPAGFAVSGSPGLYYLSGSFIAGGWCTQALVKVQGVQISGAPLPLAMNSPDINGDGIANLADIGIFVADLVGVYHWRSDFNGDGTINLADVGFMAMGVGSAYPLGFTNDPVD